MSILPAAVAKCGTSHGNFCTYSALPFGNSIAMSSSQLFTSTMRAISTSPIFQCLMFSLATPLSLTVRQFQGPRCRNTQHHVRGFLGHHHNRGVGVAADDAREYRRICHAQSPNAMHTQLRVDDRVRIHSHAAAADRMVNGVGHAAYVLAERLRALGFRSRLNL